MNIYLPTNLVEKIREHLKKTKCNLPIEVFIEEAVEMRIESYPWFTDDICVHSNECMHRKSVESWREDNEFKY